jgi:primosomal replication protein N
MSPLRRVSPARRVIPEAAENQVVIAGSVCQGPQTRFSPAGIPITQFTLDHHSQQLEAGVQREAVCRLIVVAVGERLQPAVATLTPGCLVRVRGFLSRAGSRTGETRLTLHADSIEIL